MGCRTERPAPELIRFRLTDAGIQTDLNAGGRGAWLCIAAGEHPDRVDEACLAKAASTRAFDRAFRCRVHPDLVADLMRRMSLSDDGGRLQNRR